VIVRTTVAMANCTITVASGMKFMDGLPERSAKEKGAALRDALLYPICECSSRWGQLSK
jgi:hypothetical protein